MPATTPFTTIGVPSTQPVPPLLITAAVAALSRPPPPLITTVGLEIARPGCHIEAGDAAVGDDGRHTERSSAPSDELDQGALV